MRPSIRAVLLACAVLVSVGRSRAQRPAAPSDEAPGIQHLLRSSPERDGASKALHRFYASRQFQPIWWQGDSLGRMADDLVAALRSSGEDGLDPSAYDPDGLARQIADARAGKWGGLSPDEGRARLELRLSTAFLRLARDLHEGRLAPSRFGWGISPDRLNPEDVLSRLDRDRDVRGALDPLRPTAPGYLRLRQALLGLRRIEANGGWPQLSPGKALAEGVVDDRVVQLRARLQIPAGAANERLFDPDLKQAVEKFQRQRGLEPDGVVGSETRAALNVPVSKVIAKMELNLERWRWMPSNLGERYILVNSASAELSAWQDGVEVLQSALIVGQPDPEWQTPVIADVVTGVDANPDWHVPTRIEREELIPRQELWPDFIQATGLTVVDRQTKQEVDPASVAWTPDAADYYELVQLAGPENPLGQTRLSLGNKLGIYLHGTPTPSRFQLRNRSLSHGCIRVEKITELTRWILSDDALFKSYEDDVSSGASVRIDVAQRVPVYVTYFTAWVDDGGDLQLRPDVYELDPPLQSALRVSSPKARPRTEGRD